MAVRKKKARKRRTMPRSYRCRWCSYRVGVPGPLRAHYLTSCKKAPGTQAERFEHARKVLQENPNRSVEELYPLCAVSKATLYALRKEMRREREIAQAFNGTTPATSEFSGLPTKPVERGYSREEKQRGAPSDEPSGYNFCPSCGFQLRKRVKR